MFANIQGINSPTMANCKVLTSCHWTQVWGEMHIISTYRQVWGSSSISLCLLDDFTNPSSICGCPGSSLSSHISNILSLNLLHILSIISIPASPLPFTFKRKHQGDLTIFHQIPAPALGISHLCVHPQSLSSILWGKGGPSLKFNLVFGSPSPQFPL